MLRGSIAHTCVVGSVPVGDRTQRLAGRRLQRCRTRFGAAIELDQHPPIQGCIFNGYQISLPRNATGSSGLCRATAELIFAG